MLHYEALQQCCQDRGHKLRLEADAERLALRSRPRATPPSARRAHGGVRAAAAQTGLDETAAHSSVTPMEPTAERVAACLGVDVDVIRRLQARGLLLPFDLTHLEVRRRLYAAYVADRARVERAGARDRL
jgi:hypothetical protein